MEDEENPDLMELYKVLPPTRCTKRLLKAVDFFLSLFVIAPLVVANWRGTWYIMDENADHFPPLMCAIFGAVLHTLLVLIREYMQLEIVDNQRKRTPFMRIAYFSAIKIYTYLFAWACIIHWRGTWMILEAVVGMDIFPVAIFTMICIAFLIALKSVRNTIAPPLVVLIDSKRINFSFPTRFRTEGSQQPGLYILDCVFSVLVVGTLVVIAWRGVWVIFDITLYPDNKVYSSWGSLIIGYGLVALTFSLQPIIKWLCDHVTGAWRLTIADIFLFISFVGTVNVWRGVWHLLDLYFIPEDRVLSLWLSHLISFILLVLLNCSNSVLVRGVYIDAEEPAGQCVVFPIYYIRTFFERERNRKQRQLLDSADKQDQNNLLEKEQGPTQNSIKIVKNNTNTLTTTIINKQQLTSEIEPMISRTNEKVKNNEHTVLKE